MTDPAPPDELTPPQSVGRLLVEATSKANAFFGGAFVIIGGFFFAALMPEAAISLGPRALSILAGVILLLTLVLTALLVAFFRSHEQTHGLWLALGRAREKAKCEAIELTRQFEAKVQALEDLKPTRVVKSVVPHFFPYPPCSCVLIVTWSSAAALAIGTGVSIAIAEDTHEHPLGFGTVRGIQEDGCAVITLDVPHATAREHVARLLTTPELKSRLRIGVQVSLQHLESTRGPESQSSSSESGKTDAVGSAKIG
jgi:hypothetical protein